MLVVHFFSGCIVLYCNQDLPWGVWLQVWKVPWQVGWQRVPWQHSPNRGVCLPAVDNTTQIRIHCRDEANKANKLWFNKLHEAMSNDGKQLFKSCQSTRLMDIHFVWGGFGVEQDALCWSYTGSARSSDRYLARGISQMPLLSHKCVPRARPYRWIHVSAWGSNKAALAD